MKDRSKERLAAFLMEELLERLGGRQDIKDVLGEMSGLPIDELLQALLDDFAQVVADRHARYLQTREERPFPPQARTEEPASPQTAEELPRPTEPLPSRTAAPVHEETLSKGVPAEQAESKEESTTDDVSSLISDLRPLGTTPIGGVEKEQESAEIPPVPQQTETSGLAPVETASVELTMPPVPQELGDFQKDFEIEELQRLVDSVLLSEKEKPVDTPPEDRKEGIAAGARHVLFEGKHLQRQPCQFGEDDAVYLHAVSLLREDETPSTEPFFLEEKGLNAREFAFALDHEGLRFYLSKINLTEMSVSKSGVLLLGKQESLQMQGVHEGIVNDLRGHGTLLPFEFGTVVRSKGEFFEKIERHSGELKPALQELSTTKWWTVTASVLDARIAQLVGTARPSSQRDLAMKRAGSSPPPSKSYDIKMLEKMLQKEIKIAESVHQQLKAVAERSDIDMIISLGSGSSENWKPVLRSSYEVRPSSLQSFYRTVTDLQYQYLLFDLMVSIAGKKDPFSFAEKH